MQEDAQELAEELDAFLAGRDPVDCIAALTVC
jgi:hypothetical protein